MFDTLDDGRRPVSRKSAMVFYTMWSITALAGTSLSLYRYWHHPHPQTWIYIGLVANAVALSISAWRLRMAWELQETTTKECGFYFFAVQALCWAPQFIHDLLA